jgi:hypothetical protein
MPQELNKQMFLERIKVVAPVIDELSAVLRNKK